MEKERIYNSLLGFVIGDAIGVPVEFIQREEIKEPITDFVEGNRSVPLGSWSDDSSLMLCLCETINEKGLDFDLLSQKMIKWLYEGYMTPFGKTFGVGRSTMFSIGKLKKGISYMYSGEGSERSNGNGSLMRILPLAFYTYGKADKYESIITCSGITHSHPISCIACCIYIEYMHCLFDCNDKILAYKQMKENINRDFKELDLSAFDRILNNNIYEYDSKDLSGLGYVVSTLEVALYSFINSNNYRECIINALNFGNDTDTNAAVAGGIAGYFYNQVPNEWKEKILKREQVEKIITEFSNLNHKK